MQMFGPRSHSVPEPRASKDKIAERILAMQIALLYGSPLALSANVINAAIVVLVLWRVCAPPPIDPCGT